jgi:hypothetical protein
VPPKSQPINRNPQTPKPAMQQAPRQRMAEIRSSRRRTLPKRQTPSVHTAR